MPEKRHFRNPVDTDSLIELLYFTTHFLVCYQYWYPGYRNIRPDYFSGRIAILNPVQKNAPESLHEAWNSSACMIQLNFFTLENGVILICAG